MRNDSSNRGLAAEKAAQRFRVKPGSQVRLPRFPTDWSLSSKLKHASDAQIEQEAKGILEQNLDKLSRAQDLLYATGKHSLLIVLQAMDAAGKDGTVKHVMSGVNPQGCHVVGFKQPSLEDLRHDFLWRYVKALPERGHIGIFNRSHYEEVLVVRVHPEWLEKQGVPDARIGKEFWRNRYEDINAWERHLARSGTVILKFFLHVSQDEQKRRFLERLENPKKFWKFSLSDVSERQHWDEYQKAYEDALRATSTKWAPWYVIPADHKWSARVLVAELITSAIQALKLDYAQPSPEEMLERAAAAKALARR